MICDYNFHCFKCNNLIFKENEYNRYAYERHTQVEKQLDFFQSEMPTLICLNTTGKESVRRMKRQIDTLMGTPALKERFKYDKVFLQAIVSYVKKNIDCIENLLYFFHDLEFMNRSKKRVEWWLSDLEGTFVFRNRTCMVKDIREQLRYYEHYINEPEIEEHLQKNINA